MAMQETTQTGEIKLDKAEIAYIRKKKAMEKVWPFFRFLILFSLCFIILYPLIYMVSCAFRAQEDMSDPTVMWIPRHFTLKILQQTMNAMDFWKTLGNTLFLNIGCSLVQVASCAITGYGFARFRFKGKNLLFGIVMMMILVPNQIIAIPQYTGFRYFFGLQPIIRDLFGNAAASSFNLIDTPWTMYLPALTANGIRAGLMIFIFRQFFKGLPKELEDAAYLDGCGPFMTFLKVMIPNAASSFLTVFLFSVVWYWNDYYVSSTFFTENATMALMLKNLSSELKKELFGSATVHVSARDQILWMEAGCLLAVTPLLLMYTLLQKYFTEGIERSGLVG
ncbi:MAG: carbohydrate ABC transporter permease [Ruminococcus sp.]|jgi:multiple sugar transport system permease protein|nr:carbohydrate ABC transporter permease [Ruminococcus sp.]